MKAVNLLPLDEPTMLPDRGWRAFAVAVLLSLAAWGAIIVAVLWRLGQL